MSGNEAFKLVTGRDWRRGLPNLLDNEMGHWFRSSLWWIMVLIWVGIAVFMVGGMILSGEAKLEDAVALYSILGSLGPSIAVIIIMQDALVGEKQTGTAAWVLSKPASRPAFILSKLAASALGSLVTMAVAPGVAVYIIVSLASGQPANPLSFLAAFGVLWVAQLYFLTFTLMLGSLLNNRGAVIAIALGLLLLQQYAVNLFAPLRYVLPWTLSFPSDSQPTPLVLGLLTGTPGGSWITVAVLLVEIVLFVVISVWQFERQEF